jgi:hypothetical protein
MNCSHLAPTSLVRSSTATVAAYEGSSFIARNPFRWPAVLLSAVLIALAALLAVGVARADTVKTDNRATLVRVTNKVTFGAVRPQRIESALDRALTRLAAMENRNTQVHSADTLPTTAKVRVP